MKTDAVTPHLLRGLLPLAGVTLLSACTPVLDRLDAVGAPPKFAEVANPNAAPDYQPLSWPMPETQPAPKQYAGSLWQPGARAFFRDQRAARVGDILRVNIKFEDKAELDNATDRARTNAESLGTPSVFGMQNMFFKKLPGDQNVNNLLSLNGDAKTNGTGSIKRKEKLETQVAALITQVLPNGNLVIDGSQEIRVNYELREVSVKGVVRPQDIKSDNTIDSSQVAQARINYGGRGQISDIQSPRWGTQVIDALSPF